MAIDEFGKEEKKKTDEQLYGYEDEEEKSWLSKIVDYIKQKDVFAKKKVKEVT